MKTVTDTDTFFLIAGPCVVESEEVMAETAFHITAVCKELNIPYIFKASYKKANRTKLNSFTGIGVEKGLQLIQKIGRDYNIPVTTDIHSENEAEQAKNYVDILQIPAFLCRQTDLLIAAAQTQKIVNIKKGQFLSGAAMRFAVDKVRETGNNKVWLTERGTTFGYQDLVVDFRNIPVMQQCRVPVIVDCTHALQKPNQISGVTGGDPVFIATIAKAAIATGANGIFIETHPKPPMALSDGANMLPLSEIKSLLITLSKIKKSLL